MRRVMTLLFGFFVAAALTFPLAARSSAASAKPSAAPTATHKVKKTKRTEHRYFGEISDSQSGLHYPKGANAHELTMKAVKAGARFVFVYRGKVLMIENQDAPGLAKFAGQRVRLIGNKSADGKSIKVDRIVALKTHRRHHG